jgi:hypothetical protein
MLLMYSMRSHYKKYMGGIEDRGSRIEDLGSRIRTLSPTTFQRGKSQ